MKTILLKLAGPLQSWGVNSHFETRHTQRYPSKSAIIGILAASLGYRRNEDDKIRRLNELDFAVRIDQPGSELRDYHIATKYKKNGEIDRTYVTNRYYIQDAVFVVALGSKQIEFIEEIEEALKAPYFQTFMGRRSLPLNADFLLQITDKSVIDSLKEAEWQAAEWYTSKGENKLAVYADSHCLNNHNRTMVKDLVISFSQKNRLHGFRPISKTHIIIPNSNGIEEHDAFGRLGG